MADPVRSGSEWRVQQDRHVPGGCDHHAIVRSAESIGATENAEGAAVAGHSHASRGLEPEPLPIAVVGVLEELLPDLQRLDWGSGRIPHLDHELRVALDL